MEFQTLSKLVQAAVIVVMLSPKLLAAQIAVTDDLDNTVTLLQPAQRIVSLAPHITETLFEAGAGDRIVATVRYSDYPAAAREIPIIGSHQEVAYEALLSLNPDLVIAWASGNGDEIIRRIKSLGITVYLDEPEKIEDIAHSLENFSQLAGTENTTLAKAADFRAKLNALQNQTPSGEKLRVFYQVWNDPITTLNGRHLVSDIIRLCGGQNVFANAIPIAPVVNVESVLNANPDVIIASGLAEARPLWLDDWAQWSSLTAVENSQLHSIPPDYLQRSSPRIIQGAQMMCDILNGARKN